MQDQKNSWQSAEELRKYKDNREKQNSVWKQRIDEPKCNIQKESKMMGVAGQPPIITHTAATPQDSPNTTLDVGYRDLNCRAVYPAAALSIESIDRSGVCCFISIKNPSSLRAGGSFRCAIDIMKYSRLYLKKKTEIASFFFLILNFISQYLDRIVIRTFESKDIRVRKVSSCI